MMCLPPCIRRGLYFCLPLSMMIFHLFWVSPKYVRCPSTLSSWHSFLRSIYKRAHAKCSQAYQALAWHMQTKPSAWKWGGKLVEEIQRTIVPVGGMCSLMSSEEWAWVPISTFSRTHNRLIFKLLENIKLEYFILNEVYAVYF